MIEDEDEYEDDGQSDGLNQVDQIDHRLFIYSDHYNTTIIYEYYDEEDNLFLVKDKKYIGLSNKEGIQSIVDYALTEDYLTKTSKEIEENENTLILHAIHSYCEYRKDTAMIYIQYKVSAKYE